MNDVTSAHQCIVMLEALEVAWRLQVNALGQVAMTAGFWENSAYANIASSEFTVAQALLPGTILENVTNPKTVLQEFIYGMHADAAANYYAEIGLAHAAVVAAETTKAANRAILEKAEENAIAASGYGTTVEANTYITLLTEFVKAIEDYVNAVVNVAVGYELWYNVTKSFGGAGNGDVEQIKKKMDKFREIYRRIAVYMDVL